MEKLEQNDPENYTPSKRRCCCCFLPILLLFGLTLVLCTTFFLVLKPKKPVFSLHAIHVEKLKLNLTSSKEVQLYPFIASMSFVTHNPNKIGIRYDSSELAVLYGGSPIGVIQVPTFYQPPRSRNITVVMHVVVYEPLNLSKLIAGELRSDGNATSNVVVGVVGRVHAHTKLMNIPLPKIKVGLDCQIGVDFHRIALFKEITVVKLHKALLLSHFPHISQKCSSAFSL